ncbi:hypothetical protein [Ruegeria atlantica]|uniref:hypothetical protein n=1 Tax=Ruegeria atlantica TaxID=81569 RepID=UPI0024944401|nr:hypothetical protein [Ruegeria atlantica]
MFTKALSAAAVFVLTATLASASVAPTSADPTPLAFATETYEVADTAGMNNRQDRRDDRQDTRDGRQDMRQDCRQSEGLGLDKVDCKVDKRQAG